MKFTISSRLAATAMALSVIGALSTTPAFAASQTITASINSSTASNYMLNMSWGAVSGATHYDILTANSPSISTGSTLWTTVTTNSVSKQMTSTVGYRYFRVYAYDASNNLLAYSNLTGAAKYQTGLVVKMKQDSALTAQYPAPIGSNYQIPTWFITLDSTVKSSYCAPNFQIGEFISESTITSGIVDPVMISHVQNARTRYGAMSINSGYRTPNHNAAVGSVSSSRHIYGDAVDVPAATTSVFNALSTAFAPENVSYIEP
ncbi:MAG: D-Ala-D-Ala carboxypeptidase family metallohydrolase, partial [Tumebacillaceae bacterium]